MIILIHWCILSSQISKRWKFGILYPAKGVRQWRQQVCCGYKASFRPHRSTAYIDAAYCYRSSSVVCRSVCLSVCHTGEPCKNGCTDRDAVWLEDLRGPREPCIRWGPDPPWEGAILRGGMVRRIVKYRDTLWYPCAKTAEPIEMLFGLWAHVLDGGPAVLRDVAMATNLGTKIAINWLCVNDSD